MSCLNPKQQQHAGTKQHIRIVVKYDDREVTVIDTRLQRRRHVGVEEGWEIASRLSALLWRRARVDRRPGNSLCGRLRLQRKAISRQNVLEYGKALDVKAVSLDWGQQQEGLAPADRCIEVLVVVLVEAGDAPMVPWTVNASQSCTCQHEDLENQGHLTQTYSALPGPPAGCALSARRATAAMQSCLHPCLDAFLAEDPLQITRCSKQDHVSNTVSK